MAGSASPRKLDLDHLPNAIQIHAKVISGGQPDGEAGFRELQSIGVKTIISVDGARPDIAAARKFGLRYVHLPHGYDGIPANRARQLAKAVRDLDGPIYIHCHHGQHRSPAAASVACVTAGLIPATAAQAILNTAGTSRNYRGLYLSAERARPVAAAALDEIPAEFPESVEPSPLAQSMVDIESTHIRLKSLAAAGWKVAPEHPDLDPSHEALLMREHFAEMLRAEQGKHPDRFLQLAQVGQSAADELESLLRAAEHSRNRQVLVRALERISQNCTTCHWEYRDIPLGE